ncbi:M23 family metallopeptidase [candidate division KSB1 bacterium]
MDKGFKIVLFSNKSSKSRELSFSKFHIFLLTFTTFVIFATVMSVGVNVVSLMWYEQKLDSVREDKENLMNSITQLNEEYNLLETQVENLFEREDFIRTQVGLDPLDPSKKEIGLGGGGIDIPFNRNEIFFNEHEMLSDIATEQLTTLKGLIGVLKDSYASTAKAAVEHKEMLRYYPSIAPVDAKEGYIGLSDRFGSRPDPFGEKEREFHEGLDIKGKIGTPVHATADGTVIKVVRSSKSGQGMGKYVKISHKSEDYGYTTIYGHLSEIKPGLEVGSVISRWDEIGKIGDTGRVTGAHLHYEIQKWGIPVDPEAENWNPKVFLPLMTEDARKAYEQEKAEGKKN